MLVDHPLLLAQTTDAPPAAQTPVDAPPATGGDGIGTTPGADTTATTDPDGNAIPPTDPGTGGGFFGGPMIWMLLLVFVIVIFFSSWTQKKERKKHEALLAQIKKGSKVRTAGGILGTVIDVRDTEGHTQGRREQQHPPPHPPHRDRRGAR